MHILHAGRGSAAEIPLGHSPDPRAVSYTHLDVYKRQDECAAIATGGMVPEGADAVVMEEVCEVLDDETIAVTQPVAPGENVVGEDEDIPSGTLVLSRGSKLRPPDIGALAAMGITEVEVAVGPRVAVISTGDELTGILEDPVPVSYTHLDVYKRQHSSRLGTHGTSRLGPEWRIRSILPMRSWHIA